MGEKNRTSQKNINGIKKIFEINERVITTLEIKKTKDMNIYIGGRNIEHIKQKHPVDFGRFYKQLNSILENPDYIGKNPNNGSLEYIKELNGHYVKVAIRISKSKKWLIRSMYSTRESRLKKHLEKQTLFLYTK